MKQDVEKDFLEMLEENKAIIYKIASLYGQTTDDRKDLIQEIVISLWKAYPAFKGNSKRSTWIYQIGLNTAFTNYRRQKNKVKYEPIYEVTHEWISSQPIDNQIDEINLLYQAIENLNKVDKAVILLHLEEKSYKEISHITGIKAANVGMKILRIKEKLAEILTKIKK